MRHVDGARVIAGGTRPADVSAAFAAVRALLAGAGPPLAPRDPRSPSWGTAPTGPLAVPTGTAVALATSGSSGAPRLVALALDAVQASAAATRERLGGDDRWLVALPIHHVAGWQILVRAALAGPTPPAVLDTTAGFSAQRLADLVTRTSPRYTSLVPTQLVRVLQDDAATATLTSLEAILVGGAAAPGDLLRRAREAGLAVVETYGMTETGGGCVYDGTPLDGVEVAAVDGRLEISGPVLATGYLTPDGDVLDSDGADGSGFVVRAGRRLLRTPDLGSIDATGRVEVLGRADRVIVTGGIKVHPGPVERALLATGSVAEAVVVGVPDDEWGSAVAALVVPAAGGAAPDLASLREAVATRLGREQAPRCVIAVAELPLIGPGKIDRAAAARLVADILSGPG